MLIWRKIGIAIIIVTVVLVLACKGLDILKASTISDNAKAGWIVGGFYFCCAILYGIIAKWLDDK